MLFTTRAYALFFTIAFLGTWALAAFERGPSARGVGPTLGSARGLGRERLRWIAWPAHAAHGGVLRTGLLLALSYYFYASWNWRYLPLIFGSSTTDFVLARAIARSAEPRSRRALLVITVALNLGFLAFFKYWNFAADNAAQLASLLTHGGPASFGQALRVALPPVGISFFTFESMSYVIDVYRGHLPPYRSYLRYLLFVSFFPHLVAGPIVRPRDLLPQLEAPPRLTREITGEALFLIGAGLLKKLAIADPLAHNLVDRVFERPDAYSALEMMCGVYGYAIQIYCDFSGYTDIATGSALLLGVRFPKNFDAPYLSANIADFWRRWHISLSSWLRDYLYVPLGGSRGSALLTYRNLLLTMVLGGLWHGASWTFVFWGFLHGAALAVTRMWERARGSPAPASGPAVWIGRLVTFHFVCFAWIFFRAPSFHQAKLVLKRIVSLTTFHPNLPPLVLGLIAAGLAVSFVPQEHVARTRRAFVGLPAVVQAAGLFGVALLLHEVGSTEAVPFVYFQF